MPPNRKPFSKNAKKQSHVARAIPCLLITLACFFTLMWAAQGLMQSPNGDGAQQPAAAAPDPPPSAALEADAGNPAEITSSIAPAEKPGAGIDIQSRYALLCSLADGEPLYEKASEERAYPASLTKIMTAILAIETIPDLEERVEVPASLYQRLYEENASLAGFLPGDRVRAIDLLYGTILPSGAEAAESLAIRAGGSVEGFVGMMNQKAAELGMTGTHFENVTGLHEDGHYSTAEDMALLTRYALENPAFRELFTAKSHQSAPTELSPSGVGMGSILFDRASMAGVPTGPILGGKTGYTEEAGLCLSSLGVINGKEYVLVTMGAPGDGNSEPNQILDQLKIYEYFEEADKEET